MGLLWDDSPSSSGVKMPNNNELAVVFTGNTGLGKRRVLERLCQFIYRKDPDWLEVENLSNQNLRKNRELELAQIYGAEDVLNSTFLTSSARDQQDLWRTSFLKALNRWKTEKPKPKFAFFSLHRTFHSI